MEWLTLSELAGKPIIKWVIQVIRSRVRNSIRNNLKVNVQMCDIDTTMSSLPIVFRIIVDSKTPAVIRIIGIDYLVFFNYILNKEGLCIPIQSGYWRKGMAFDSNGYSINDGNAVVIKGNSCGQINVSISPFKLGWFPKECNNLGLRGTIYIDSSYGQINIPFEALKLQCDASKWEDGRQRFTNKYQSMKEYINATS